MSLGIMIPYLLLFSLICCYFPLVAVIFPYLLLFSLYLLLFSLCLLLFSLIRPNPYLFFFGGGGLLLGVSFASYDRPLLP